MTKTDLREYTLAENVTVTPFTGGVAVEFDWLCPHCGKRHWSREFCSDRGMSLLQLELKCGRAKVRLPGADQTPREISRGKK